MHPESQNSAIFSKESNEGILFTIRSPEFRAGSSAESSTDSENLQCRTEFRGDSIADSIDNSDLEAVIDYENFQNGEESKISGEYYEEMVFSTGKKSIIEESLDISGTYEDVGFNNVNNTPRYENMVFDGKNKEKVDL